MVTEVRVGGATKVIVCRVTPFILVITTFPPLTVGMVRYSSPDSAVTFDVQVEETTVPALTLSTQQLP